MRSSTLRLNPTSHFTDTFTTQALAIEMPFLSLESVRQHPRSDSVALLVQSLTLRLKRLYSDYTSELFYAKYVVRHPIHEQYI